MAKRVDKQEKQDAKRRKPSQRVDAKPAKRQKKPMSARTRRVIAVVACIIVLVIVILYPVGRDFYSTMRTEQRLQAQLDAVNARNEAVKAENDALQTEEGIENQAHSDLGWVKEGEEAVVVTNAQGTVDNVSRLPDHLDKDSIRAPQTWYYNILDVIFFVEP